MLSLFKNKTRTKVVTTEEIHAEIDKQEITLATLLENIGVEQSSHILRKATLASKLGFKQSEVCLKAKELEKQEREIFIQNLEAKEFNYLANLYKMEYPLEKILTVDQFQKVLDKYSLVSAPADKYIKDIPEKVLLTIDACKPIKEDHISPDKYKVNSVYIFQFSRIRERTFVTDYMEIYFKHHFATSSDPNIILKELPSKIQPYIEGCTNKDIHFYTDRIDTSSIQVAAPVDHFDATYMKMLNATPIITDDPIAFQYLKGGFVRILDKWGTPDDQSYLDSTLTNEILN